MGLVDKFSNILGGNKSAATETVKGPSRVLRDAGIDPSNLKFDFGQDNSIAVSGQVDSQGACDRICEALEGMPNIKSVQNDIIVGVPEPVVVPEPEVAVVTEEVASTDAKAAGRTYTVQ